MGGVFPSSLRTDGAYADSDADDDEPVIRVTHGYSRDHRPDLKQIVTLCLLVYAAVQWRVRQALQQSQQTCPDQKGKPNPRPTARRVFQSFINISVLHVSSLKAFVVGLTAVQEALLTLLGDCHVALHANSG